MAEPLDGLARIDRLGRVDTDQANGYPLAVEADGTFTETVAFTNEASARSGEGAAPPPEVAAALDWAMQGATFYDLPHPWFESAS